MSLDDSKFETGLQNAMDGLDASRWGSAADQASSAASDNLELDPTTFEAGAGEAVDSLDSAEFAGAAGEAGTAASTALDLDGTQYAEGATEAAQSVDAAEFAAAAGDAGASASDALELDATGFAADATDAAGTVDPGEFGSSSTAASTAASDELELDDSAFTSSIDGMLGQFDPGEWQASAAGAAGAAVAGLGAGALTSTLIGAGESASTAAGRIEHIASNLGTFGGEHTAVAERIVANAEEMGKNTGISPVAIQEGQAMLLTFDSLAESAAETGGTFDRVTAAGLDIAANNMMSTDGAARMLGRAMEDPIGSLTRLERVGVYFNDTQTAQIEKFMEAGDAASAQAVILDQVEGSMGGLSGATADASDKMAVAWEIAAQSLGEEMLPAFERFTEVAIEAAKWVEENETLALGLAGTIAGLAGAVLAANVAVIAYRATMVAWTVVTQAATVAQRALNLAMRMNPIGRIITLIAALVAGLIWFFTQTDTGKAIWQGFIDWLAAAWEWLKETAVAVFDAVVTAIVDAWNWIKDKTQEIWDTVVQWIQDNWDKILDILSLANPVTAVIRHWDKIKSVTGAVWDWIVNKISGIWNSITTTISNAVNRVKQWISNAWNNVKTNTSNAFNNVRTSVQNGINNVVSFVRGLPGRVLSALGNLGSTLFSSGWSMIDGLRRGIVDGFNNALSAVRNGLSRIRNFFPFSPAKEGPFSGSGYTDKSGKALVSDFADGMRSAEADVVRQAESITRAAAFDMPSIGGQSAATVAGGAGSGVGGVTNNFTIQNPVAEPTSETARKASAYIGVSV